MKMAQLLAEAELADAQAVGARSVYHLPTVEELEEEGMFSILWSSFCRRGYSAYDSVCLGLAACCHVCTTYCTPSPPSDNMPPEMETIKRRIEDVKNVLANFAQEREEGRYALLPSRYQVDSVAHTLQPLCCATISLHVDRATCLQRLPRLHHI
jgi:hypothetical protein